MAEQWISAAKALEIVGDRCVLCSRLHAGLALARARLVLVGDKPHNNKGIPANFWWAGGHAALEQDWEAGDFSTNIHGGDRLQAFGVSIGLAGVLEAIAFEKRAETARRLSVAGNPKWMTASEARAFAYGPLDFNPMNSGGGLIEQAKMGFVTARAVLAQGKGATDDARDWDWEEREWDIPDWFWNEFTQQDRSTQDWSVGKFSGRGFAPDRTHWITLSGVHFLRGSLQSMLPQAAGDSPASQSNEPEMRGRRSEYDWIAATSAVWGLLNRRELIPDVQADIELALMKVAKRNGKEPSQSTARPFAKPISEEFHKP